MQARQAQDKGRADKTNMYGAGDWCGVVMAHTQP